MKEKELHNLILCLLLQRNEYVTSKQLAIALNVSRKTINNYMSLVKENAERFQLRLISKRGKGFLLTGESNYRKVLIAQLYKKTDQPVFQEERLLYLLHLLLNEGDLVRISELQDILHLSRPSIYKTCEEVNKWLSTYQLKLQKSRTQGLTVSEGEKRHRLAIIEWMSECEKFLNNQKGNEAFLDSLKLHRCLQYYEKSSWTKSLELLIKELQDRLSVVFLFSDIIYFKRSLQIILIRYQEGHSIQLPQKRVHLIQFIDQHQIVQFLQNFCSNEFCVQLPETELMYFLTLIIVSDSYQNHSELDTLCIQELVDEKMLQSLHIYLNTHLCLSEEHVSLFFTRLIHIMQRELVYQIHEKQQAGHEYYLEFLANFKVLSVFAKEMTEIILEHYDICYYDKFVYHLSVLLDCIVEKEKHRLRCILLHDCNAIELELLQIQLASYLQSADVIQTMYVHQEKEIDFSPFDLILTNSEIITCANLPVLQIPKYMNYHDIVYYNQQIHELFQKLNFARIVKDTRIEFSQL